MVNIFRVYFFLLLVLLLIKPINGNEKSFKLVIEGDMKGLAYLYIRTQGSNENYNKIKIFLPGVAEIDGMQSREIFIEQHLYFFVIKKSDVKIISLPQLYPVKMNYHYEVDNFRIFASCFVILGFYSLNKFVFKFNLFSNKKECINGKYFLQNIIGEGGMATVYKAIDSHGKIYAIKIPHTFCLNNDISYKRFVHEALIVSRLKHPYITSVLDWSTEKNSTPFICMEYIEGKTIEELIKNDSDLKNKIICYVMKTAEALSYAHSQNIIHRDIKPSNIIITSDGNVKLTDFGIARAFDLTSVTVSDSFVGTPIYMAPEQIDGSKVDCRVDLYSLGIILYEVYSGKKPFDDSDPMMAVMKKMANEAEDISTVVEVKEPIKNIIMKLIKKNPNDRYQTADELINDLSKVL